MLKELEVAWFSFIRFVLHALLYEYLSNFLDLAATFPDEGATLAGRHHNA